MKSAVNVLLTNYIGIITNAGLSKHYFIIYQFAYYLGIDSSDFLDMLAATSVLQQQAADIRNQRINWQSYLQ